MHSILVLVLAGRAGGLRFHEPLFTEGLILQRGDGTRVWGNESEADATVTITLTYSTGNVVTATAAADHNGTWVATLPTLVAGQGALRANDGTAAAVIEDVAVGEVFLHAQLLGLEGTSRILDARQHRL